jgi:replicative DNA helicase
MRTPNEATARQAELGLLAGLMLATKVEASIFEKLTTKDFEDARHAAIWLAISEEVRENNEDAPSLVVVDRLKHAGRLELAGGFEYVMSFDQWALGRQIGSVEQNVKVVRNCARLRRIARAAQEAINSAEGMGKRSEIALGALSKAIEEAQETDEKKSRTAFDSLIHDLGDSFRAGLKTRTPLDQRAPLTPGRLCVIGGRPGHGKTTITLQLAAAILRANEGARILVASCEMTEPELALKVLSALDGRDFVGLFRSGDADPITLAQLSATEHHDVLSRLHLRRTRSMDAVTSEAFRLHREGGLAAVVIDYLSAFDAPGSERFDTRSREVGAVAGACKTLAQNLDVVVLAASQLNRNQTELPSLRSLRDSGEIEQWADSCLLLHRPDVDESKEDELARLIVAKNRWGELGHIPLVPDLKHSRFLWMDNRRSG